MPCLEGNGRFELNSDWLFFCLFANTYDKASWHIAIMNFLKEKKTKILLTSRRWILKSFLSEHNNPELPCKISAL